MMLLEQQRLQHIASWLDNNPDGSFCRLYEGTYLACARVLETVTEAGGIAGAQDSNVLRCYTLSTDK